MTYTCTRCAWTWTPRPNAQQHGSKPVRCPGCGSKFWNEKEGAK